MSDSRLAKLLGMLGSSFDGERANAAAMIAKMAADKGVSIADLCLTGKERIVYKDRIVEKTVYRDRPAPREDDDFHSGLKDNPGWRSEAHRASAEAARKTFKDAFENRARKGGRAGLNPLLAALRAARGADWLSAWEEEFIDDILAIYAYDDDLSPRQQQAAKKIQRKLERADDDPLL